VSNATSFRTSFSREETSLDRERNSGCVPITISITVPLLGRLRCFTEFWRAQTKRACLISSIVSETPGDEMFAYLAQHLLFFRIRKQGDPSRAGFHEIEGYGLHLVNHPKGLQA